MASDDALNAALRALRYRDLSSSELESRLAEQGFSSEEQQEAIETLLRTGLADDVRYAEGRARSLADRGAGDQRIRHELRRAGLAGDVVDDALAALEPESARARSIVAKRGAEPKTARYLRGKGFSEDVIAGVVAGSHENELG